MAVGLGALFETEYLYGLSERESSLLLTDTHETDPYRFFNIDYYGHRKGDPRGEYGSIPYVTGHTSKNDASLLWLNSADTWTDLIKTAENKFFTNFVSESGVLELFLFASDSPKTQLETLTNITGHATLPPIEALGYHFSKYADVSADIMMERDSDFETYGFPVDYFWMDILYAQEYEYFTFDQVKFPPKKHDLLNK
jgi:mannosyl-oligosaccharide alpha-1,3-glucosidase